MLDFIFYASRIAQLLVQPAAIVLFLTWIGVLLLWLRRFRTGRLLLSMAVLIQVAVVVSPLPLWLLQTLEYRFPRPDPGGAAPDGIIVLSGSVETRETLSHDMLSINAHGDRVLEMVALARRFPDVPIVYSGGHGSLRGGDTSEAVVVRDMIDRYGIDPARIRTEVLSRNTYENALYSFDLVGPAPGERWLLVTSAMHMPRSIGAFRAVGWEPIPYPVDYQSISPDSGGLGFSATSSWREAWLGLYEYLGLVTYYLTDRSSAWFPAPQGN